MESKFVHPASASFGIHFFVLEIEKDGTFRRFKITDESEKEVRLVLYPSYTIELSKSEYLFYVLEKSRDVKVGKITFK
ncbi:MAG: hypothetical protein H7329_13420 [Opitutaceae bacterium]|nr:hypothetical protein [Cytophagales bacterium]